MNFSLKILIKKGSFMRVSNVPGEQMKLKHPWLTFKTKMLTFHPKANLDLKILFGKITHPLRPEIWKMPKRGTGKPVFSFLFIAFDLLDAA